MLGLYDFRFFYFNLFVFMVSKIKEELSVLRLFVILNNIFPFINLDVYFLFENFRFFLLRLWQNYLRSLTLYNLKLCLFFFPLVFFFLCFLPFNFQVLMSFKHFWIKTFDLTLLPSCVLFKVLLEENFALRNDLSKDVHSFLLLFLDFIDLCIPLPFALLA